MVIAEGMGGGDGGLSTGWIVTLVVGAALLALAVRSRQVHRARARVGAHVRADAGWVQLHDLLPPGAPPSMSVGVRLSADTAGTQSISEDHT